MAKMQEILDARDRLRLAVEDLDGGYATIGRLLNKSKAHIFKALSENNVPRLGTLEEINDAVEKAKRKQTARLASLNC